MAGGYPLFVNGKIAGAIGLGVFEPGVYAAAIRTSMCAALISDKPVKGRGLIVWPYLYKARELSYYFAGGEDLGKSILLAGGVTKSKLWRQIFADVTGYPVVCPKSDVEAYMGDVMLAGIGGQAAIWYSALCFV